MGLFLTHVKISRFFFLFISFVICGFRILIHACINTSSFVFIVSGLSMLFGNCMVTLIDEIGFVYKWMDGYVFETVVCICKYIVYIQYL